MQMHAHMQFYLNVLPFFVYCIVMVPHSFIRILLHSGTSFWNYSEWEIVIWPIEAGFFEHSFPAVKPQKDVIISVSIIYIFFITCKQFQI